MLGLNHLLSPLPYQALQKLLKHYMQRKDKVLLFSMSTKVLWVVTLLVCVCVCGRVICVKVTIVLHNV